MKKNRFLDDADKKEAAIEAIIALGIVLGAGVVAYWLFTTWASKVII